MAKTTSLIGSKYSAVLPTYQKDQIFPSFQCKVWWGSVEWHQHISSLFFSNDALPDFKQLTLVGLVFIVTWFLLLNLTQLIFRIFNRVATTSFRLGLVNK